MMAAIETSVTWLLPTATLLLGYVGKSVTDWIDFRRVSKRERVARGEARRDHLAERRTEFQRKTLLDLQEAIMRLVRCAASINHEDVTTFRKTGVWGKQLVGDELSENHRLANASVTILRVRVRDQSVRDLVRDLQSSSAALTLCGSEQESTRHLQTSLEVFNNLNERVGELLRGIDEEGWHLIERSGRIGSG